MYKFVKIHNKRFDIEYDWALLCEDYKTLTDHTLMFFHGEIKKGISDLLNQRRTGQHLSTVWGHALQVKAELDQASCLIVSQDLERDVYNSKANMIGENGAILLRENCSYAPITEDCIITETIELKDMIYPNKNIDNIRLLQWDGGVHWYAKIGGMDVVDKKGNQKWDTKETARQAAIEYLK